MVGMSLLRFAFALSLAACYGSAPPTPPRVPLPDLVPGQQVTVVSETETRIESVKKKTWYCPQGHAEGSPACSYSSEYVNEPVTHTKTTALYGADQLTREQLNVMADPEHEAKRTRLGELQQRCTGARVPRTVGLVSILAGLVLWGVAAGTNEAVFTYVGAGALGVGSAAYAYGYFTGGSACGEANEVVHALGYPRPYTVSEQSEMEDLARTFNERMRASGAMTMRKR